MNPLSKRFSIGWVLPIIKNSKRRLMPDINDNDKVRFLKADDDDFHLIGCL